MSDYSLSLYFGLKEGEKADLEVVARSAIKWVEAVKAAAKEIDPHAQLRIELIDASESSLRLNTVLEWAEKQLGRIDEGTKEYPRLRQLAVALVVFVAFDAGPAYEFYFGDTPTVELSEEDRKRLDELIDRTKKAPEVQEKKAGIFQRIGARACHY